MNILLIKSTDPALSGFSAEIVRTLQELAVPRVEPASGPFSAAAAPDVHPFFDRPLTDGLARELSRYDAILACGGGLNRDRLTRAARGRRVVFLALTDDGDALELTRLGRPAVVLRPEAENFRDALREVLEG